MKYSSVINKHHIEVLINASKKYYLLFNAPVTGCSWAPLLLLLVSRCWLIALVSQGVGWLLLFSSLFLHPWLLSCNVPSGSVRWLLQTPHYRTGTPSCLIKSLGLILQPAPLLRWGETRQLCNDYTHSWCWTVRSRPLPLSLLVSQ